MTKIEDNIRLADILNSLNSELPLVLPTPYFYGIACDAANERALEQLQLLKTVAPKEAIHAMVAHDAMLERHLGQVPDLAYDILDLSNKPTIIVYENPVGFSRTMLRPDGTLGIYVAQDRFCQNLIGQFKKPLAFFLLPHEVARALKSSKEKQGVALPNVAYVVNLQKEIKEPQNPSILQLAMDGRVKVIRE